VTLAEIQYELQRRTALRVQEQTLVKGMKQVGIERYQNGCGVHLERASRATAARYGYEGSHRARRPQQDYPTSVTDAEWALVRDLFEKEGHRGKPPKYPRRQLLEACCYVVRTGCSWRMLPKGFPPWQNVYRTFRLWSGQGKFEQMHDRLRTQWREREQRGVGPSAAVIDAQATRGSPRGGETGYDAGSKVKGRKRHLGVDTLGLLLAVSVTAASVPDRDGAHPVMGAAMAKYPGIETLLADSGYVGRCVQTASQCHDVQVTVVPHSAEKGVGSWQSTEQPELVTVKADRRGVVVLPGRWVVERTHAWVERAQRLVLHDRLPRVAEAWVWLSEARRVLKRLTASFL
jgi:transposase